MNDEYQGRPMHSVCAACGKDWGSHYGNACYIDGRPGSFEDQPATPPGEREAFERLQPEIECDALVAWNGSKYAVNDQDAVHPMFLAAFKLGYRAALAARPAETEARFEVRVAGPDDVHHFASEIEAHRMANSINRTYLADRLQHPDDEVLCVATVHPSNEGTQ